MRKIFLFLFFLLFMIFSFSLFFNPEIKKSYKTKDINGLVVYFDENFEKEINAYKDLNNWSFFADFDIDSLACSLFSNIIFNYYDKNFRIYNYNKNCNVYSKDIKKAFNSFCNLKGNPIVYYKKSDINAVVFDKNIIYLFSPAEKCPVFYNLFFDVVKANIAFKRAIKIAKEKVKKK